MDDLDRLLCRAARKGSVIELDAAIRAGANIECINKSGQTPLHQAIQWKQFVAARHLVLSGANVNAVDGNGDVPLVKVISDPQTVAALLAAGASPGALRAGRSALHIASDGYDNESTAAQLLLEAGADIESRAYELEMRPLHVAAWNGNNNVVKLLVGNGAEVNALDKLGRTPLHWTVVDVSDLASIRILVSAGADVRAIDSDGDSALSIARRENSTAAIELLEEARSRHQPIHSR